MILLDEIIELLSSDGGSLSDALVRTKVLLHKIGHKELAGWVNNELNGYSDKDSIPEYRILPAQVFVNAASIGWQFNAHPIPLGHLTDEQRESIETAKMDQSLAVLEQFAANKDGHLRAHIPMETYGILGQGLQSGVNIQQAWSEISYTSITQILIQVRSRLLDFLLELQANIPSELSEEEAQERVENVDASSLFNNAIFGDNTTILVGDKNTQTVTNINLKGDFDALARVLRDNHVSDEDINSLQEAIRSDEDQVDTNNKEYGPAVKNWLQVMLSKAVDTSWSIELGVASSLLATALNSYYGWF